MPIATLARVLRGEDALRDLGERAVAAHVDDDARAVVVDRLAYAIDRRALGLGRDEPVRRRCASSSSARAWRIQSAALPDCAVGFATSTAG